MARRDLETLVIGLEAKLSTFEKSMNRAYPIADRAASQIERRFQRAESTLASFGKGFAGSFSPQALIGSLSIGAIAAFTRQAVSNLAEIQDAAQRAGLSIENFQKLSSVARQGGGTGSDIVTLFQALNVKLAEAVSKGGDLADLLKANNISLVDQKGQLRDNVALFEDIADLVKNANSDQERGYILRVAFNKSAADSLPFLREGAASIRQGMRDSEALGIQTRQEVEDASKLDDTWQRIADAIERAKNSGGFGLAQDIQDMINLLARLDDWLRENTGKGLFMQPIRDVLDPSGAASREKTSNDAKIKEAEQQAAGFRAKIADADKEFFPGLVKEQLEGELKKIEAQIAALRERNRLLGPIFTGEDTFRTDRPPVAGKGTIIPPSGKAKKSKTGKSTPFPDDVISDYVNQVVTAESGGRANAKNPRSSATGLGQFIESTWIRLFEKNFPDRAKSMSRESILALRKDADISRAMIESYARENADSLRKAGVAVNMTSLHLAHFLGPQGAATILNADPNTKIRDLLSPKARLANPEVLGGGATAGSVIAYAQRRANAYRRRAGDYTDAEKESMRFGETIKNKEVDQKADALHEQIDMIAQANEDAAEKSAQAWDDAGAAISSVAQGFVQDLMNGVKASDALKNALARLADAAISSLFGTFFQGGAGGGGLFGSLFNGVPYGGARAAGGPVSAGRAYTVGEHGPEKFVPLTAGHIIPTARAAQQAPLSVRVTPSPYFNVIVDQRADALDGARQSGTLNIARRNAPRTMSRFQQLGTV